MISWQVKDGKLGPQIRNLISVLGFSIGSCQLLETKNSVVYFLFWFVYIFFLYLAAPFLIFIYSNSILVPHVTDYFLDGFRKLAYEG